MSKFAYLIFGFVVRYSKLRANLNKVSVKKTTTAWKDITHRSKITAVCELLEIQAHSKWFLNLNILCTVSGTLTTNPKIRVCKLGQMISWLILIGRNFHDSSLLGMENHSLYLNFFWHGFRLPIFEKGKERHKINRCRPEETQELTTHQNIFCMAW